MLAFLGLPSIGTIGQEAVGFVSDQLEDGGRPECMQWNAILGGDWGSVDMSCPADDARTRASKVLAAMGSDPSFAQRVRSWYGNYTPDGGKCSRPSNDKQHARLVAAAACNFWGGSGSDINQGESEARQLVTSAGGGQAGGGSLPEGGGGGGKSTGETIVDTVLRILTGSGDLSAVEQRLQNTAAGAEAGSRVPTSTETGFGTGDVALFVVAGLALVFLVTQVL